MVEPGGWGGGTEFLTLTDTLGRQRSKKDNTISMNVDQKFLETEFLIAICRSNGNRKHCFY